MWFCMSIGLRFDLIPFFFLWWSQSLLVTIHQFHLFIFHRYFTIASFLEVFSRLLLFLYFNVICFSLTKNKSDQSYDIHFVLLFVFLGTIKISSMCGFHIIKKPSVFVCFVNLVCAWGFDSEWFLQLFITIV